MTQAQNNQTPTEKMINITPATIMHTPDMLDPTPEYCPTCGQPTCPACHQHLHNHTSPQDKTFQNQPTTEPDATQQAGQAAPPPQHTTNITIVNHSHQDGEPLSQGERTAIERKRRSQK